MGLLGSVLVKLKAGMSQGPPLSASRLIPAQREEGAELHTHTHTLNSFFPTHRSDQSLSVSWEGMSDRWDQGQRCYSCTVLLCWIANELQVSP